jgi:hypothetical protein
MTTRRQCKYSSDVFCYVCGFYIAPKQVKHQIVPETKFTAAYEAYFGMAVSHQNVDWAPHVSCGSCRSNLEAWYRGSSRKMPFRSPRIWRKPTNHSDDCYFCLIDLSCYKKPSDRTKIRYPDLRSTSAPVPNDDALPFPLAPVTVASTSTSLEYFSSEEYVESENGDETFEPDDEPHLVNQTDLNDLVRDLGLTKEKAELLGSRLKQWNLLDRECKTSVYRKRHQDFSQFFAMDGVLCYCTNVCGLFEEMGLTHKSDEWRLFIDSSSKSLKAVLLHNGNKFPSIPVAHSANLKEEYKNVKILLEKIQ